MYCGRGIAERSTVNVENMSEQIRKYVWKYVAYDWHMDAYDWSSGSVRHPTSVQQRPWAGDTPRLKRSEHSCKVQGKCDLSPISGKKNAGYCWCTRRVWLKNTQQCDAVRIAGGLQQVQLMNPRVSWRPNSPYKTNPNRLNPQKKLQNTVKQSPTKQKSETLKTSSLFKSATGFFGVSLFCLLLKAIWAIAMQTSGT